MQRFNLTKTLISLSTVTLPFFALARPALSQSHEYCAVYETNGCSIPAGSIVCGDYNGIRIARKDMNKEQLESLNCLALQSETIGTAKRIGLSIDTYAQFVVTTPTKVLTLWAHELDMTARK